MYSFTISHFLYNKGLFFVKKQTIEYNLQHEEKKEKEIDQVAKQTKRTVLKEHNTTVIEALVTLCKTALI
ncbi:hypothetical protein T05_13146 [Trichinella murrelli]|uniref:Uncharacterized protein n=1 Tax=Trichinella murrelli TaxID=144512 RepID=A0A0V0TUJ5_9BILA|nr:hypothetical protein T05_13146 [Trichinella murrelli]